MPLLHTMGMSKDAVIVVFALTALGAWYGRHLVQTIADVTAAKARLAGARKARWGAWKIAVPVGLVAYVALRSWLYKHGG